jgi:cytoskeletal protein CcmA (bactofilin family)
MVNDQANQSHFSADVEITGTIKCSGPVRIDGKLDGDLNSGGDATIGKSANVKGNLSVNSITVEGTINGNITAKDRIELKSTARVTGDIKAKRLAVEDGVMFVGKSEVNPSGAAMSSTVAAPKADVVEPRLEQPRQEDKAGLFARR